jgi:glycosyltransferase involved in cell wall biosynthesis
MVSTINFSVIICTFNRAELLDGILGDVCAQRYSPAGYEIIIIDNGSLDSTFEIAQKYSGKYSNVFYYFEPRQGLSHARNLGALKANGEYLAYVDDDARINEIWLVIAQEVVDEYHPDAFGGPFYPFYISKKPNWYKDEYGQSVISTSRRRLYDNEYLSGGNLFITRKLLHEMGMFDSNYGMSGTKIGYAEETILQANIRKNNPDSVLFYEPKLFIQHLVPARKMKLSWRLRDQYAAGRDHYWMKPARQKSLSNQLKSILKLFGALLLFIWHSTIGSLIRDRRRYQYYQNYLYEVSFLYLYILSEKIQEIKTLTKRSRDILDA